MNHGGMTLRAAIVAGTLAIATGAMAAPKIRIGSSPTSS